MAELVALGPATVRDISRAEYRWGKDFRVFAKADGREEVELDLGIPKEVMKALLERNGAAFTDALSTVLALASGKKMDVAHADRDRSFPSHARCITFRTFQRR